MDKVTKILLAAIVAVVAVTAFVLWDSESDDSATITSYEECVEAGYPIMESYPEQCSDGEQTWVRVLSEEELDAIDPVDEAPVNVEEATLEAVGEYTGSGFATRSYEDEVFLHEVITVLNDPAEGKFYEGWLVTPGATDFISTGELISEGADDWSLMFSSDVDYSDYTQIVITEETTANGLDGVPEAHVLEGSF